MCILITHQLQYLKNVEHTVLMQSGRIEAQGSFENLKNSKNHSLLCRGVNEDNKTKDEELQTEEKEILKNVKQIPTEAQKDNKEDQIIGSVGLQVYASYFKSVNNIFFVTTVLFFFAIAQTAISSVDLFISKW